MVLGLIACVAVSTNTLGFGPGVDTSSLDGKLLFGCKRSALLQLTD